MWYRYFIIDPQMIVFAFEAIFIHSSPSIFVVCICFECPEKFLIVIPSAQKNMKNILFDCKQFIFEIW